MTKKQLSLDCIITYSKIVFDPLAPEEEDIIIEDIAHALSLMTRANGHFIHFYSVAQHSINCCREAFFRGFSPRIQLACLLHDASESYISDLTRPVKRNLQEYAGIEERLQNVIYSRFGLGDLSGEEKLQIEEIDDALLQFEFEALMGISIFEIPPQKTMDHDFAQKDCLSVEREFLSTFNKLVG